ncbi:MAG TPA: isoprenylcysteine carboxylmethyltransferase family protein [Candidatus Acidoferrales bacterium]
MQIPFVGHPGYYQLFVVSYVSWILFEVVTGRKRKTTDPAKMRDRGSFFFLVAMVWVGIALDVSISFQRPQTEIPWMRTEIFFLGIALMWAGLGFRYYAMRVLGKYFTFNVAVHAGQTVVETGPYKYIRHPSYTGALITLTGFGLAFANWGGLLALMVCTGIGYAYRVRVEEAALVAALGEPYRNYMARTWRFVPYVI